MRFADSGVLWLLFVPLLAMGGLVVGGLYRRYVVARLGDGPVVERQLIRSSYWVRVVRGGCLVLGLCAVVVAAARPQFGGRTRMLKKRGIDIAIALDFSKSMLAQDVAPDRIRRAKMELDSFVTQLTGDRVGLVAFAGDTMSFPLTTDYAAATVFWKDMTPYDMPRGGTAIGKALNAALRLVFDGKDDPDVTDSMAERTKVIVLLTDGEDHEGDPMKVAQRIADKGVTLFTVGIGSDSPELIPRYLDDGTVMGYQRDNEGEYVTTALSAEHEQTLRAMAELTGGVYYRAGRDMKGLAAVIGEIRAMKQSEIESRRTIVYDEYFQMVLALAIVLLFLAYSLGRTTEVMQ